MAGDVAFKFTGDSSDLRAELQKVDQNLQEVAESVQGVANDGRKGLDKLGKSAKGVGGKLGQTSAGLKKVKTEAKSAGTAAHASGAQLDGLKDNAADTASTFGGLATALSVVSPELGNMARVVGDAATGLEAVTKNGAGMAAILGPIGVAVAAVGGAYVMLKGNLDDANAAIDANKERLADQIDLTRQVKEATLLAALAETEAAAARGEATKADVQAAQARIDDLALAQRTQDLFGPRRQALIDERQELKANRDELTQTVKTQGSLIGGAKAYVSALIETGSTTAAAINATSALNGELTFQNGALDDSETKLRQNETQLSILEATERRYADATKRAKKATEAKTAAEGAAAKQSAENQEGLKEQAALLETLRTANKQSAIDAMIGSEQAKAIHAQEIDRLQELAEANLDNSEILAEIAIAKNDTDIELALKLDEVKQDLHERELERDKETAESKAQLNAQIVSGVRGVIGASMAGFAQLASAIGKEDAAAGKKVFALYKTLAIADIGLKTAQGYMTAASLPPPASGLKYAEVSIAAATSAAMVASQKPSFHDGSSLVRAPSGIRELNATLREGEAVATPLGAEAIGRDRIDAANAGMSGGGSGPTVFQYEHRQFSQFIRDNLRRTGPLSKQRDQNRRVGYRGTRG